MVLKFNGDKCHGIKSVNKSHLKKTNPRIKNPGYHSIKANYLPSSGSKKRGPPKSADSFGPGKYGLVPSWFFHMSGAFRARL